VRFAKKALNQVETPRVTILTAPATRTIAIRASVVAIAFSIPLAFGVWERVLSPSASARPTPTAGTGQRLLAPSMSAPAASSYAFIATQQDGSSPVAFDPCRPIHYVVRSSGAPAESDALVAEAVQRISSATGLQFVADGSTAESPVAERPNFQPDRYGDRWAPVLIAWSSHTEFDSLAGSVIGVASSAPVDTDNGDQALVSGQVALDTAQLSELLQFNGGRSIAVATITHELAHLVGLAHVDDPQQLMYPSARPLVTNLGSGDRAGLAALGSGTCHPTL
jgi:hypothetical protein